MIKFLQMIVDKIMDRNSEIFERIVTGEIQLETTIHSFAILNIETGNLFIEILKAVIRGSKKIKNNKVVRYVSCSFNLWSR